VLPLPPAELPSWDGKPETLIDAAKQLVPESKVPPSAGSQRTGRADIPQGYELLQGQLPPMAERQPIPAHHHGRYLVTPQGEQGAVPYSGYWLARLKEQGREYQREWNSRQLPQHYAKGERFDATDRSSMGEYARFNSPQWHYQGEAVKRANAPPHPKVMQGIARSTRVPEPLLRCTGSRPCPGPACGSARFTRITCWRRSTTARSTGVPT
jgi:hypothetical protein